LDSFQKIEQNLRRFVRQFYISALLKGLLMFLFVGLLFALFFLIVEHFLWLNSSIRTLLFWFIISFETVIFYGFILSPLFKLFRIQKGIDFEFASKIIGDHFPEIKDKLLNVLQLKQHSAQTELLLASIEQKSNSLKTISFKKAVDLSSNIKYIKYAFTPVLILFVFFALGKQYVFTDSLKRVVNFQANYSPPAPFEFVVANPSLSTLENSSFTLKVTTQGSIVPEAVSIVYNDAVYLLSSVNPGVFEYQFLQPKESINFKLSSGSVISAPLQLTVVPTPLVLGINLYVYPPKYTQEPQRKIENNGNATVPEGSKLKWEVLTKSTDTVVILNSASFSFFDKSNQKFTHVQQVFRSMGYSITTSNSKLKNFENLDYFINLIKDKPPLIQLQMKRDSTLQERLYFYGQVSDDYGVRALRLHYFPTESPNNISVLQVSLTQSNPQEFTYAFPDNLNLLEDMAYSLYFEVIDNDRLHNYKSTRSRTFTYKQKTAIQLEASRIKEQSEVSNAFQKALKALAEQDQRLKEISINQKETQLLNYSDQQKLKQFIERQKSQDKLLTRLNQTMERNLNRFKKEGKDVFKDQLQKRLKTQQEELKKNEKILEEIEKVASKINKEELANKLAEMAKQSKNKQRSLEQLLELTKRYYVTKKSEQINSKLKELSESQEQLADKPTKANNKSTQQALNKSFDEIRKEIAALKEDNNALAKPLQLLDDPLLEESIAKDQEEALESLEEEKDFPDSEQAQSAPSEAQKSQKKAAQKMQLMTKKMSQNMSAGGTKQMSEDIEVLRQILDNLILFSFEQEALMNQFVLAVPNPRQYAVKLLRQSNLRTHFEHVEDSLFALSLRQPMISELISKEVAEVFFNIDKSLALLSENELQKGVSSQQFAMMAINKLADLLSNTLSNMEAQLELSPGQGQGEMQLPDIITSQESLNEQMEQKLGEKGKESEGESAEPKSGNKGKEKEPGGPKSSTPSPGGEGEKNAQESENEVDSAELFEIFKKQQQLRTALQDLLQKNGMSAKESDLLKAMNKIEENLVNQGVTTKILNQMKALKHQLLKLNKATLQQGEDSKRESGTSKAPRSEAPTISPETIKQYFSTTEILNRQSLPLRQELRIKVQEYFKTTND
tara:strand:+ start:579 stop:3953 length:3375 start_codon:yes stop_codon:yes gene_type:complete